MEHQRALTTQSLFVVTSAWLLLYAFSKLLLTLFSRTSIYRTLITDKKGREAILAQGPAYLVSTIHALYLTPRGLQHLRGLLLAPITYKLLRPRTWEQVPILEERFFDETTQVVWSNLVLAGYLAADIIHVVRKFPKLGGFDTLFHHFVFFSCALVAGYYELYPFMFGWLIAGEMSTPFLNTRWLLIKAGYGSTKVFDIVQMLFAFTFASTRFFLYGTGLFYQLVMIGDVPSIIPRWAVFYTTFIVITGFLLNLVWLWKIAKMALGTGKKHNNSNTNESVLVHTEREQSAQRREQNTESISSEVTSITTAIKEE